MQRPAEARVTLVRPELRTPALAPHSIRRPVAPAAASGRRTGHEHVVGQLAQAGRGERERRAEHLPALHRGQLAAQHAQRQLHERPRLAAQRVRQLLRARAARWAAARDARCCGRACKAEPQQPLSKLPCPTLHPTAHPSHQGLMRQRAHTLHVVSALLDAPRSTHAAHARRRHTGQPSRSAARGCSRPARRREPRAHPRRAQVEQE